MAKLQDSIAPTLDGLGRSIDQLFAPEARSPPTKSGRTVDKSPSEPFNRAERTWLAHTVGEANKASTMALVKAVDARIEVVETDVLQLRGELGEVKKALGDVDVEELRSEQTETKQLAEGTKHELRQAEGRMLKELEQIRDKLEDYDMKHSNEMNEMRELVEKTTRDKASSGPQASAHDPWFQALASGGKANSKAPSPKDTSNKKFNASSEWSGFWILGNLGYDTATDTLIERAKDVLGKLPSFSFGDLVGDIRTFGTRPGSAVLIKFKDLEEGEKWRPKVFDLDHKFPENSPELRANRNQTGSGTVYLRKQPTDTERRPLFLAKRCGLELGKVEDALPSDQRKPVKVAKTMVSVSGKTVGYSFHGTWQWTDEGISHLRERGLHRDAFTSVIEGTW